MIASFTKWDNSLSGTLGAGPMGVPLSEVLLYMKVYPLQIMNYLSFIPETQIHDIISKKHVELSAREETV